MPQRSLVEPSPLLLGAADLLPPVVAALLQGDAEEASRLLGLIDEPAFRAYWNAGGLAWERLHDKEVHGPSEAERTKRDIPAALRRDVVERDGWRCRYCGLRLLARDFITGLNARCPDAFPWGATDATKHALGLVCLYTPDHVIPWWKGGGNDLDNLVASCGTCNYQKGSCSLEELDLEDPRSRPVEVDAWDGYAGVLR